MRVRRTRFALVAAATVAAIVASLAPTAFAKTPAQKARNRAPADYIAMADQLSQPIYPETIREVVRVDAFDGKDLYLEVVRPDPAAYPDLPKLGVILEASPYHGTLADRAGTRMFPDPVDENGTKIGLTGYFPPRGYAVVMFDLRGTGRSQGCLDHVGPNDSKDLSTVIEWAASQDWSNGRVGMTGHSYVGSTPSVAAALPADDREGLVTIVPSAGLASMYDHQFNKGVPWLLQWVGPMYAYEQLALYRDLPPGVPPPPVVGGGPSGDNWANAPNPEIGCGMQNSAAISGTGQVTGQYQAWHAARDWREGATATDIPIFMIHGVNDNAARIPAAEWFFGERYMRQGDKVWLGQWDHGSTNGRCGDFYGFRVGHPTCRFDQMQYAIHAWFDKHLLERNVDTGPPVEVFLNGETPTPVNQIIFPEHLDGRVYTAPAWREPKVFTSLFPDATDMSLDFQPPTASGSRSFNTIIEAILLNPEFNPGTGPLRGRITFRSDPLKRDAVYLGLPQMLLNASVTNPITHLTATLWRERTVLNEEGEEVLQREPMNFCAIQPMLRDGVETVAPVVPGQQMPNLPMQCFTMAHWVPRGQSLALEISTGTQHHASFGDTGRVTVFTGPDPETTTRYELPVLKNATLHDDVPLLEDYPQLPPPGPAQPAFQESVIVPAPGVGTARAAGITDEYVVFNTEDPFDNARLDVIATTTLPGDVDLFLQKNTDTGWQPVTGGVNNGDLDGEELFAARLPEGQYRIVVHNWGGPPNQVEVTGTFFNRDGQPGPGPGQAGAQAYQAVEVNSANVAFLPLP